MGDEQGDEQAGVAVGHQQHRPVGAESAHRRGDVFYDAGPKRAAASATSSNDGTMLS
jgi:hypothetical protein